MINRAFLFTLVNSEGVPPTKYDVTHPKYATLHHPRFVDKNNFKIIFHLSVESSLQIRLPFFFFCIVQSNEGQHKVIVKCEPTHYFFGLLSLCITCNLHLPCTCLHSTVKWKKITPQAMLKATLIQFKRTPKKSNYSTLKLPEVINMYLQQKIPIHYPTNR